MSEMHNVRYFFLNPFYWIIGAYTWLYAALAASFARHMELRCDRAAVEAYGQGLFAQMIVGAHLEGSFFTEVGMQDVFLATRQRRGYHNIYHHIGVMRRSFERKNQGYIRKVVGAIMTEKTHRLATHPSLGERLKKQNIPTALVKVPPLPRLLSTEALDLLVPPDLLESTRQGPPSAAEELFGAQALKLQSELSEIAASHMMAMMAIRRQAIDG